MALLFGLGAARDLWRAAHPRWTPPVEPWADVEAEGSRVGKSFGAPPAARSPAARVPEPAGAADQAVDLNRAGVAELDALPGIGPVLARRIVEHRSLHGEFRSVDELLAVRGIGPKLFARLEPRLTVSRGGEARRAQGPIVRPRGS